MVVCAVYKLLAEDQGYFADFYAMYRVKSQVLRLTNKVQYIIYYYSIF